MSAGTWKDGLALLDAHAMDPSWGACLKQSCSRFYCTADNVSDDPTPTTPPAPTHLHMSLLNNPEVIFCSDLQQTRVQATGW
jgi:hypothetical protein